MKVQTSTRVRLAGVLAVGLAAVWSTRSTISMRWFPWPSGSPLMWSNRSPGSTNNSSEVESEGRDDWSRNRVGMRAEQLRVQSLLTTVRAAMCIDTFKYSPSKRIIK